MRRASDSHIARQCCVGTYSEDLGFVVGKADGIYVLDYFDDGTMSLDLTHGVRCAAAACRNPTYLAAARGAIFAVDERGDLEDGGRLVTLSPPDSSVAMCLKNAPKATADSSPCHLVALEKHIIVANYCGGDEGVGSVAAFGHTPSGSIGELQCVKLPGTRTALAYPGAIADRQDKAHAHMTLMTRGNEAVLVPDLGSNVVWRIPYDATQATAPLGIAEVACVCAPGAGPRHAALHPTLDVLYVLNELSKTLATYATDAAGSPALASTPLAEPIATVDPAVAASTAALRVHPSGRFIYASNRVVDGEGSIACFPLDPKTGLPTAAGRVLTPSGGNVPREMTLVQDGQLLLVANQNSDNILSFKVDATTGALTKVAQVHCPTPVCIVELPP